jgi:hypothetical protein
MYVFVAIKTHTFSDKKLSSQFLMKFNILCLDKITKTSQKLFGRNKYDYIHI